MESSKIRLYKGLFSIILIATIMTLFELCFYIFIVNPNVIFFIGQLLKDQPTTNIDKELDHLLVVFNDRENILINEINIGAYIIIIVEIAFMLTLLGIVYMKILQYSPNLTIFKLKDTIGASFATLFILISFQIMFFFFGLNFHYMGRYGINEINKRFADIYLTDGDYTS